MPDLGAATLLSIPQTISNRETLAGAAFRELLEGDVVTHSCEQAFVMCRDDGK